MDFNKILDAIGLQDNIIIIKTLEGTLYNGVIKDIPQKLINKYLVRNVNMIDDYYNNAMYDITVY